MTGTCHILIVDDELEIQRLTKRFLGQYDLRVSVAGSGDEALKALQEWNIDLVVLDVMLPGMDGFETCRHDPPHVPRADHHGDGCAR